tara:strand:+ start:33 stop:491 length:459 start_codon:yes stop_codon:yes gene_type:complete
MNEKKFFSLLSQLNELKKNKKAETPILIAGRIPSFDPEASDMLFDSMNTIRNNFHFSERQEYIDLAKDFLADQITEDDFSYSFIGIYDGIEQKVAQMEKDESLELTNFLKTSQFELNDLLSQIYSTCDFFGHVIFDEKELKDYAQILLLKLQ